MLFAPVTVIIPCFRCVDTIKRAVESVISQTIPPYELFLIDDFSHDNSRTIETLRDIKRTYSDFNIVIFEMKINMGPGTARNLGWNSASQPYIAFLDADDAWHPNKIEIQYLWMRQHPEVILTSHKSVNALKNSTPKNIDSLFAKKVEIYQLLLFNFLPCRSVMLKKNISERFMQGKYYAEDYLLWLTIILNGGIIYYLNLPLSYSFKGDFDEGGLSSNLEKSHKGVIETYNILYQMKLISSAQYYVVIFFSFIKYVRRRLLNLKICYFKFRK